MSLETIRSSLVTAVEAARTAYGSPLVIEYDNRLLVDTQKQSVPFLSVEIKIIDGQQADLADAPIHRIYGQLVIAAAVKHGAGVKAANDLLGFFYPRLHRTTIGPVRTRMATFTKPVPHLGWVYYPAIIPFWANLVY